MASKKQTTYQYAFLFVGKNTDGESLLRAHGLNGWRVIHMTHAVTQERGKEARGYDAVLEKVEEIEVQLPDPVGPVTGVRIEKSTGEISELEIAQADTLPAAAPAAPAPGPSDAAAPEPKRRRKKDA